MRLTVKAFHNEKNNDFKIYFYTEISESLPYVYSKNVLVDITYCFGKLLTFKKKLAPSF